LKTTFTSIPREEVEEIRGKDGKAERGEPEARPMTSFFSSSFYGAPSHAPRRTPPEGCLCGEQEEEEKEAYPPIGTDLQV
jgi:hypothetical protein